MSDNNLIYKMAFANIAGITLDLGKKLLEVVGSEKAFFEASERDLVELLGQSNRILSRSTRDTSLRRAEQELRFIQSNDTVKTLYYDSPSYPRRLLEIEDAPMMLYCIGSCDMNTKHVVSIVGTRHSTPMGVKFCDRFVAELTELVPDVVVVSGLAYGIDIASHRAALSHGAPTIAVMAKGLNRIYPAVHRRDAIEIVKRGGLLVTEYMTLDEMHKSNFLARNRIIAGLSDCTIVVESASHGGSLVTASLAMSYNRDVMAVPGRVGDEFSRGCNKLIAGNRAALLTDAEQFVAAMQWSSTPKASVDKRTLFPDLTPQQQSIIDKLKTADGPLYVNDIAAATAMPAYQVTGCLVELDFMGLVVTLPGGRYALA